MFATQIVNNRNHKDEAEKPFWISYADLMTALMMLFLVVMSVALLAVTRTITEKEKKGLERDKEIRQLLQLLAENVKKCGHATVSEERYVIDFGPQGTFPTGSHQLTPAQASSLQACVPEILTVATNELGKKWIKRIVVEGYTDQRGSYLYNLNLSLQRSERVLCVLLGRGSPLTLDQRKQVRNLFLVGGYSFNLAKTLPEESRRVELRLEFWGLEESREGNAEEPPVVDSDTLCELDRQQLIPVAFPPATVAPGSPAPAPANTPGLRRPAKQPPPANAPRSVLPNPFRD
jgi:outer membrane protein OmpA-like peptidoglycan-associated protein